MRFLFVVTPAELTNVVIKINGQAVENPVDLEAGTYTVEVSADNCEVFNLNITITADTATHTQTIAMTYLPSDYTMFIGAIAAFLTKVETSPFSDVSTSAYYYEAVKWAQEKGITGGIGNGLFGPKVGRIFLADISRHFRTFLLRKFRSFVVSSTDNST